MMSKGQRILAVPKNVGFRGQKSIGTGFKIQKLLQMHISHIFQFRHFWTYFAQKIMKINSNRSETSQDISWAEKSRAPNVNLKLI